MPNRQKIMKKNLFRLSGFSVGMGISIVPLLALAQTQITNCKNVSGVSNLFDFICKLQNLLNTIVPFAIALGVVYLVWGIVSYVISDEEEAKKKGRDRVIYGIIGLVIIFGIWGIVGMVSNTLNINSTTLPIPCVPGQNC